MIYMHAICKELPARQPTSEGERRAAEYVQGMLERIGIKKIVVQPFKGITTLAIPATIAALIALPSFSLGWQAGHIGQYVAGVLLLLSAHTFARLLKAAPPFFRALIERYDSQNVIATIPPSGKVENRIYLLGHLDANKQRFMLPPAFPALMKPLQTLVIILPALAGLSFWASALFASNFLWLQIASIIFLIGMLVFLWLDELQPTVEGANDNASAMSVLLAIGTALQSEPLQNTEVTLLFTGCEEVGHHGLLAYLTQYKPPVEHSYWIDLELVGAGNLCYATQHGISYLTQYRPTAEILRLAEQTAKENPELGVVGKNMLILEEVANLRRYGYHALCLMGYDKHGYLPHWHRITDRLENIEPDTLSRSAQFTWAMIQKVDKEKNKNLEELCPR